MYMCVCIHVLTYVIYRNKNTHFTTDDPWSLLPFGFIFGKRSGRQCLKAWISMKAPGSWALAPCIVSRVF